MAISLTCIDRVSDDIESLLTQRGFVHDAVRIHHCYGWRHCHSAYCIKCMSRRVYRQRKHLLPAIQTLLATNPQYQLWFLTGAAEDSSDINAHAWNAVSGMKRLLKHARLKRRVIAHFSVLEVAYKRGRKHPCAHVHSLVVSKPMDKGKYRISQRDWIALWEVACPLHRKRQQQPPTLRRRGPKPWTHPSFVAKLLPRDDMQQLKVIRYCTKWATPRVTRNYRRLLAPDPNVFLKRIDALKGVPRFFGELHQT